MDHLYRLEHTHFHSMISLLKIIHRYKMYPLAALHLILVDVLDTVDVKGCNACLTPYWVVVLRVCLAVSNPNLSFRATSSADTWECRFLAPIYAIFMDFIILVRVFAWCEVILTKEINRVVRVESSYIGDSAEISIGL
jgi:hypothetical protein